MINLPDYKKIHCIGIGGIGLSAVAEILMARGYDISGSDMRESDMTAKLAHDGAQIYIGHKAENVEGKDLIILCDQHGKPGTGESKRAGDPGCNTGAGSGCFDGRV